MFFFRSFGLTKREREREKSQNISRTIRHSRKRGICLTYVVKRLENFFFQAGEDCRIAAASRGLSLNKSTVPFEIYFFSNCTYDIDAIPEARFDLEVQSTSRHNSYNTHDRSAEMHVFFFLFRRDEQNERHSANALNLTLSRGSPSKTMFRCHDGNHDNENADVRHTERFEMRPPTYLM